MAKRERDEADDNLTRRDADRRERDAGGDGIYIETETSEGYRGPNLSGDAGRGRDPGGVSEDAAAEIPTDEEQRASRGGAQSR